MSRDRLRMRVTILRRAPGATEGRHEDFEIEIARGDHVLNLLAAIRRERDGSLGYPAHFCKVGTCGACALVVDGVPRLGCRTRVESATLRLEPARGRAVLADLLTDDRGGS